MKVKAYVFAIAAVLSVVSLILFLISAVSSGTSSILSVILSGVFSSSFVSLIIVACEYFQNKRTAIENLYTESERIKKQIHKNIRYLAPYDFYELNESSADKIKESINGYLSILDIDLDKLGFLFDDVFFVSEVFRQKNKRKKRLWIHKNIYKLIYDYKRCVAFASDELRLILNNPSLISDDPYLNSFKHVQESFFKSSPGPMTKSIRVEATYLKNIEENNDKLLTFIKHESTEKIERNYIIDTCTLP